MKLRFGLRLSQCLLIFSFFTWLGVSVAGNTAFAFELNADPVLWNRLSYRAKSIIGNVTTDVDLTVVPAESAAGSLIDDPAGEALQLAGATVHVLTVDTDIRPLFGSSEKVKSQSWFDPKDSGALQRVRLRQGKGRWQKTYRFAKRGVFRLRKAPNDTREENLPPGRWTKTKASFYPFDAVSLGCSAVLEPSSLLTIAASILQNEPDRPRYLCVFNKKQLHRIKVFVDGSRRLKVGYLEKSMHHRIRREYRVDAVKISFQPHSPVPTSEEPEAFSFLGLKGDFDIYVDPKTCLPVQVSGKIATIGKLDIRLVEVQLKKERN